MSLVLNAEIERTVQKLAMARHCTAQSILTEAIRQFAAREERRENLWQTGHAAWQEYQETGLHLTMEEMDSWMAKIEIGEEAQLPKCHI
ncbi:MAG: CopG family transcriptional regulator [Gallionella sp.]|nr:CopG family transcriptional regulator [Gallionella sp.]